MGSMAIYPPQGSSEGRPKPRGTTLRVQPGTLGPKARQFHAAPHGFATPEIPPCRFNGSAPVFVMMGVETRRYCLFSRAHRVRYFIPRGLTTFKAGLQSKHGCVRKVSTLRFVHGISSIVTVNSCMFPKKAPRACKREFRANGQDAAVRSGEITQASSSQHVAYRYCGRESAYQIPSRSSLELVQRARWELFDSMTGRGLRADRQYPQSLNWTISICFPLHLQMCMQRLDSPAPSSSRA